MLVSKIGLVGLSEQCSNQWNYGLMSTCPIKSKNGENTKDCCMQKLYTGQKLVCQAVQDHNTLTQNPTIDL